MGQLRKPISCFIALAVLVYCLLTTTTTAKREMGQRGNIGAHIKVTILNLLPNEQTLTLHCKSGDKDLHVQYVPFNGTFSWKFRDNFFMTTLYFCGFNWHAASGVFDIFKAKRDAKRCLHYCDWEVHDDGVYGFTEAGHTNDLTYYWPPPPISHANQSLS